MVRVNAVADMFASGLIWAPDTRWAREVIEEVAAEQVAAILFIAVSLQLAVGVLSEGRRML